MTISQDIGPITNLLTEIREGSREALDELLPLVYAELRRLASIHMSQERRDHTLQPTALVHEAYLRLKKQDLGRFEDRSHFFGVAARLMREILIDHARSKSRKKRGGVFKTMIEVDLVSGSREPDAVDILAVDDALNELSQLDEKQAAIVEMKFFGGMTIEEIADATGLSPATVKREWATARLFLRRKVEG